MRIVHFFEVIEVEKYGDYSEWCPGRRGRTSEEVALFVVNVIYLKTRELEVSVLHQETNGI